jgi:cytochrome c oxidase subunit 2
MNAGRFSALGLALLGMLGSSTALAAASTPERWQLNMTQGVTTSSQIAYDAHMMVFLVCVVIGILVFGAMAVAMFRFRKSKGAVAATWSHNTTAEVIWTVIPVLILIVMAVPATKGLINLYDTRDAEMTVKITGYQWMWRYEYMGEDVSFTSRLDAESERIRQSGEVPTVADAETYLLNVDNELVLPTDTKIRFLITADDVIHAWWVPALGWKQDAIPGIANDAWTEIREPGVYRGQCAELCGKDHGFMPIVVRAVPRAEYDAWLVAQRAGNVDEVSRTAAVAAPAAGEG